MVNLTADVQLTVNQPDFALKSGLTLTIDTHGHLLDGATNAADADFTFTTDQGGHTILAANSSQQQPTFAVASATDLGSAFRPHRPQRVRTRQHNAMIDLGHNDTLTMTGLTPQQLQAALGNAVHLH